MLFLAVSDIQSMQLTATLHLQSRAVKKKKNRILNISRIKKKTNPHSNAKRCIRILGVRQAALSVAHEMR